MHVVDLEIQLPAAQSEVWQALTQPEHLSAWFAPAVSITAPGAGAVVELTWGAGVRWNTIVDSWHEDRHVRWLDAENGAGGRRILTDFFLQPAADHVRLRLVQSGFGEGESIDELLEATKAGWSYYFAHLKHYLEHHFGRPREAFPVRSVFEGQRSEVWRSILDPDSGLVLADAVGLEVGRELNITLDDRSSLEGVVLSIFPERTLGISLPEINQAIVLIEIEAGQADCHCGFWLSTYDWPDNDDLLAALATKVRALQASSSAL